MDRLSTSLLQLFASLGRSTCETVVVPEWRRHFDDSGVKGSFVLFEPARERYRVFDPQRAERRTLPAATFDIANALVGLEVGAIADESEVFPWDGTTKPLEAWERDHTLGSGLRDGVAWMFQEVARRTGKSRMREWIDRLEYGNRDLSGGIEHFWTRGGLRVSAMEQVRFLHRLAEGRLPMTQRAQRLVRSALAVEKTRERTLYAHAGAVATGGDAVAWWVGWIERKGRPQAYFAMNFTPGAKAPVVDAPGMGRGVLREAGVL